MMGRESKETTLITGGTGFLGSHLVARFLAEGRRVVALARNREGMSAAQRMVRLLDWLKVPQNLRRRLEILEADLEVPRGGLDPDTIMDLQNKVDECVHCASDTSFAVGKREQVQRVNVQGLENLLDLLAGSRCRRLHLISTAYVAGKQVGKCSEDLPPEDGIGDVFKDALDTTRFHNVYEQSKHRAEHVAMQRCAVIGMGLTIYRPSIVYGDSRTGRTLAFNALYHPVRAVHYFRKLYTEDILRHGGRKAGALGIHLDADGTLHLPIRVLGGDGCGVNLIPVDFFLRAFQAIRDTADPNGVYHIVNPRNTFISEIVTFTNRFFQLTGLRSLPGGEDLPRNGLELLFDRHVQAYGAYMRDARVFDRTRAEAVLNPVGVVCPAFTYKVFAACMRFAVDVDWGRRLWSDTTTPVTASKQKTSSC
ncbi:MAG: NAD-dependent epimerase/dehydratase family protein [Desulfovibrionales bacterium]|nr:MAG: NAD-dependent epimerase/dehydratase family protein [Desulfovibrionales bacterium]